MKDKEKQLTAVIEKVLRDTQNCDMSIETLTDYLVDRIKNKVFPEGSVVLSREEYAEHIELRNSKVGELVKENRKLGEQCLDWMKLYHKQLTKTNEESKKTAEKILKLVDNKLDLYRNGVIGGSLYDDGYKSAIYDVKRTIKELFGVDIKEQNGNK